MRTDSQLQPCHHLCGQDRELRTDSRRGSPESATANGTPTERTRYLTRTVDGHGWTNLRLRSPMDGLTAREGLPLSIGGRSSASSWLLFFPSFPGFLPFSSLPHALPLSFPPPFLFHTPFLFSLPLFPSSSTLPSCSFSRLEQGKQCPKSSNKWLNSPVLPPFLHFYAVDVTNNCRFRRKSEKKMRNLHN